MALTVASAALDTTWVEFGAVGYTASTLATLSMCMDQVSIRVKRGDMSATSSPTRLDIVKYLIRAKQKIAREKQYTWKRRFVTTTLTAGSYRYSMPPDYDGNPISLRDTTNDRRITVVQNNQFDVLFPDLAGDANTGQIQIATVKNMELWVAPAPDGADVLELEYSRSGDDIDELDISWLPQLERWRCIDIACAESFEDLHDFEKAKYYRLKAKTDEMEARKADNKKRWAGIKSARSTFQA